MPRAKPGTAAPEPLTRTQRAKAKRDRIRAQTAARDRAVREAIAVAEEVAAEHRAPRQQRVNGHAVPIVRRARQGAKPATTGFRANDPLWQMHRKSDGRTVTRRHLAAVKRIRSDYEVGVLGASPPRSGERVDAGQSDAQEERQLLALDRYTAACRALGPMAGLMHAAAIEGVTVTELARRARMNPDAMTGVVVTVLTMLDHHYHPPAHGSAESKGRKSRLPAFDFAVGPGGLVIAAERLGFGRPAEKITRGLAKRA
jgi:hypothetical protein